MSQVRRKTSIIIPFYNEGMRLKRACDSARNQRSEDVEILLVDDGSTDQSLALAYQLAAQDPRIRVLTQENKGLGAARNLGMARALGDFILFLDADDELVEGAVANLIDFMETQEADLVASTFDLVDSQGLKLGTGGFTWSEPQVDAKEAAMGLFDYRLANPVWAKAFRRSLIRDLWFPDRLWFEDLPFMLAALTRARTLALLDKPLWKIYARPQSISRRRLESRRIRDSFSIFELNHAWALDHHLGSPFLRTLINYQWDQLMDALIFLHQDWKRIERPKELESEIRQYIRKLISMGAPRHPFKGSGKRKDRFILWVCLRGGCPWAFPLILWLKRPRYRAISRIRQLGVLETDELKYI